MTCFICVQPLEQPTPISSHNLSELLTTTCKLLEIRDILEDEWKLLETPIITLCCSSCAESLQRIKQLDDQLQRLQGRLKESLHNLKATVVSSSNKMNYADVSQWNQGFFKFRSHLSAHHNQKPESMTEFDYDEDPLSVNDYSCDPFEVEHSQGDQNLCNYELNTESSFIEPKPKELVNSFEKYSDFIDEDSLNFGSGSGSDIAGTWKAPRKRKIVVIAEEDEPLPKTRGFIGRATLIDSHSSVDEDFQPSGEISRTIPSDGDKADGDCGERLKPTCTQSSRRQYQTKMTIISMERQVFVPTSNPEKWFVCGIEGCASGHNFKAQWVFHAENSHPGADLIKIWNEMPTREFSPRRLLHCGHSKCRKFDCRQLFNRHMKAFHPESYEGQPSNRSIPTNTVNCDMCGELVLKADLLQHVRDHVGDYAIECPNPKCAHAFCTAKYYKLHLSRSRINRANQCISSIGDGPNLDNCEICGYHDAAGNGLRKHMEMVHETGTFKPYTCPVKGCLETFSHRQTVLCHIAYRHSRDRIFKLMELSNGQICPECSKPFPRDEISSHFTDFHNAPIESIVSCQYCPYKSLTKEQLIDHFVVHFRADIAVACDICTEEPIPRFSRLGPLRRHYLEVHQIGKSFICEHCSKTFTTCYLLDSHIRQVHSAKPARVKRMFTCDHCVEESPVKYDQVALARHNILVHGAEPYKCPTCSKTFTSWKLFTGHKKEHKTVTRPLHTCDFPGCGFTSLDTWTLAQHKASIMHCGRTNAFVCEDCGKGFNTEQGRRNHRKQHADVKQFVCDVCGSGFVSTYGLRIHARLHTGELPFECSICKHRFNDRGNLKKHIKAKHPNPT